MRTLKGLTSLLFALFFAVVFGGIIAAYFESSILLPAAAIFLFSIYAGTKKNDVVLRDGVYTEAWIGELVKKFRFKREWMNLITRYDQYVKNKVIHLVDVGADPEVYIDLAIDADNPVPTTTRDDADIPISLNRYDSANTRVSLTELRSISYDKMAVTLDLHMNSISDKMAMRGAWNLAATAAANIKLTSGQSDSRAVAKKRLTPDDMVMMSEIVSTPTSEGGPDWPEGEGVAVLDFRHVADLQKLDQLFDKQWKNAQTGELFDYNGWKIFKFNQNAKYTDDGAGNITRNAFGAAADPANDLHSSLFFLPQRSFTAMDSAPEMFYRIASNDPELRSNTVGFRHWGIVAKKKSDGFYSLVSPKI